MADTGNNRIQKFTPAGGFVIQWGTPGSGALQFNAPVKVAADTAGRIYVVDSNNDRIQVFNQNGNFLNAWGTPGTGNGQFTRPSSIAVGSPSNYYVTDSASQRVQRFEADAGMSGWMINLAGPGGLTAAAQTGSSGSFTFMNLKPGLYTVSEVLKPGYLNTSVRTLNVSLQAGQTVNVTTASNAFGNTQPGNITGLKYLDLNQDGLYDGGDTPLSGWTITLSNAAGPVGSTVTGANGFFQFTNLVPGLYTISEVVQPGYLNTSAKTLSVALQPGQTINVTNSFGTFGNVQLATIYGIKYLDNNQNSLFDNGDTSLSGWTINLANASGQVGSVVTNVSGAFQFSNLVPGQYTIDEVMQPGYINTSPTVFTVSLVSGQVLNITDSSGAFGNIQLASIYGIKYLDLNQNGLFDNSDTPLSGWTINLTNSSGQVGSTVTNSSGAFQFTNLVPGLYTIYEIMQPGYTNTSAATFTVTLTSGELLNITNSSGAFGNIQLGTIGGIKYLDVNQNGAYDPNAIFVTKWGSQGTGDGQFGQPFAVATNSSNFVYVTDLFNNNVQVFDSAGNFLYKFGSAGSGNGQFQGATGIAVNSSDFVFVSDGSNNRVQVFDRNGIYLVQFGSPGSGDGQFNGPLGLAFNSTGFLYVDDSGNSRVEVFDSNFNFVRSFGSAGSGTGQFQGLNDVAVNSTGFVYASSQNDNRVEVFDANGNFLTQFAAPIGPIDLAFDSADNVYVVVGFSASRVLVFDPNGNFLTQFGSLGSGDGQFDAPYGVAINSSGYSYVTDRFNYRVQAFSLDTPLPGWTIDLTNSTGLVGSQITDSTGSFQFANLVPDNYTVSEVLRPGYTNTSPRSIDVTLGSGQTLNATINFGVFGNVRLASINGIKYLDSNLDGIYDNGDTPLANWVINLFNSSGTVGTQVTDANGFFSFTQLVPGQYTISEVVQPGYLNTSAKTLDVTLASGQALNVTNTFGAFGNVQLASVQGLKYLDANQNGMLDAGDSPLAGWTINLFNSSGLVSSQVTDASGAFQFSDLVPGQYTVSEVLQPGYTNTSPSSVTVNLGSGQALNATVNFGTFGNVQLASVQGLKYLDANLNGAMDVGDSPLAGWTINLANSSGPVGSTVTDANGFFQFTGLMPGQYTLSEVVKLGYSNTSAKTLNIVLASGQALNVTSTFGAFGNKKSNLAFVTNEGSGNLSVINTDTNLVDASISFGSNPPNSVAVTPDGTTAYVVQDGSSVSAVNTSTLAVITTIPVGSGPRGIAINPAGTRAYISNRFDNTVSVINTATNTVIATVPVGSEPYGIAVTPDGVYAYVACNGDNSIRIIDTATNLVAAVTSVSGGAPSAIVFSPDGSRAYITATGGARVCVFDTSTNTEITHINTQITPRGIAINPSGSTLYVANQFGPVTVIDTATNSVTTTVPVGSNPYWIAINPAGTSVYVTDSGDGTVSVIDAATNSVTNTIPVGTNPIGIAISSPAVVHPCTIKGLVYSDANVDSSYQPGDSPLAGWTIDLFNSSGLVGSQVTGANGSFQFANLAPGQYTISEVLPTEYMNTSPSELTFTLQSGEYFNVTAQNGLFGNRPVRVFITSSDAAAYNPAGTRLYVADQSSNAVSVLDGSTNQLLSTITGFSGPTDVVVSPDGSRLYVTNSNGTVTVVDVSNNQFLAAIPVGSVPEYLAINPSGTLVYVTNSLSDNVSVIDTGLNAVVTTIPGLSDPLGIAVSPAGSRVYVANNGSDSVAVLDTNNNQILTTIPVGSAPRGIAISPAGTLVYVSEQISQDVKIIDPSTNQVIGTQSIGFGPAWDVAFYPNGKAADVTIFHPTQDFYAKIFTGDGYTILASGVVNARGVAIW